MTHASYALPYSPAPTTTVATDAANIAAKPVDVITTSLWSIRGIFSLMRLVLVLAPMAMK